MHEHKFVPIRYTGIYKNYDIVGYFKCACGETYSEPIKGMRVPELFPPERWYPTYLADPGKGMGW